MSDFGGRGHGRDWSMLPPELLRLISERVEEIGDYVRFGAVCKPWLSASSPAANLPPQLPWLLLPYDPDDTLRRFYSISRRRTYTFDLPSFRGHTISTSSQGWLVMADAAFSFTLFNPITQVQIDLPPLSTSLLSLDDNFYANLLSFRDGIAAEDYGATDPKTQLLVTPKLFRAYPLITSAGQGFLAVILGGSVLAYCKVEDKTWIPTNIDSDSPIEDVTYHGGRFYIVHKNGEVATWEFSPEAMPALVPSLRVPVGFDYCHMAKIAGELQIVVVYADSLLYDCFKLDQAEQRWAKSQDIGNHALFLKPTSNSIVAAVAEASECRRNCIYFCLVYERSSPLQALLVKCVSIEDGREEDMTIFTIKYHNEYHNEWLQSTWFIPSLC